MARARKAYDALSGAWAGAFLMILYLHVTLDPPVPEVERLWGLALLLWPPIAVAGYFLGPKEPERPYGNISPALSGSIVVLATGLAAAVALGWGFRQAGDLVVPGLVAALTLAIAWFVFRYASGKAGGIGEARFVAPRSDNAGV